MRYMRDSWLLQGSNMFGAAVPCSKAGQRLLMVTLCIVCVGPGGCMVGFYLGIACWRYCCRRVASWAFSIGGVVVFSRTGACWVAIRGITVAGIDGIGTASGGTGVAVWMVGAWSCSTGDVAVLIDAVVAGVISAKEAGGLDTVVAVMIDE